MKTTKNISISNCCEYKTFFCSPSLGEQGFYFCNKCNTECKTKQITIQTHIEKSKGIYELNIKELEKYGYNYKDIR